jgi:LmbE family N-acetylglucosaminyl deacetylase
MDTTGGVKTVLAIEAHADDATLGVGALLIRAARDGHRVVIVTVASDFSTWGTTAGREQALKDQLVELAGKYGFERIFLDYPYHRTSGEDLALKQQLAEIHARLRTDVALIHHDKDHWPDHAGCARASHDALLFPHGLTEDLQARACPVIYAFDVSPRQTFHFQPDTYFEVAPLMKDYMDLILSTCSYYFGWQGDEGLVGRFVSKDGSGASDLRLCPHGLRRFADCVRFGNMAQCQFAIGLRTVWGMRGRQSLF